MRALESEQQRFPLSHPPGYGCAHLGFAVGVRNAASSLSSLSFEDVAQMEPPVTDIPYVPRARIEVCPQSLPQNPYGQVRLFS
jgi:hypothetical protein